ncbi:ATP-binding cassette domain-containing protein [Lysobacter sp. MMG2]|uniref:ABC-F family ATP-binding cassette domain-containing protein n=1 Tax=Lysobacter sp. MMG2 TaxID=2801338 RepID=UPI001C21E775|nr:ABC-F family ATP-binding cassette domain-containing protein [Lysobacter sp. MMG2]MBU8977602.1 ATP-binding cassette domain-containing protein [Lysobacter sp. MMG2]
MSNAHIRACDLVFSWPDGTRVLDGHSFVIGPSRTGLVAPNGAGKSTLLRLMAGELKPASGTIQARGAVAYLPQGVMLDAQASVAAVLGVESRLEALHVIAEGRGAPADFDLLDGEWGLRERIAATLAQVGLVDVALSRRLASLSGGEAMSLALAAKLLQRPDILLLDEPTNHLDRARRQRFREVLADWPGCVVVASHDRELLNDMDQIAELQSTGLRLHGGGFDAYLRAAVVERQAAEQRVRNLRGEVDREKRERQQAHERAERRMGNAAKNLASSGLPRIVAGNRERAAQQSAGKARNVHAARLASVGAQLQDATRTLVEVDPVDFSLPATRVASDRLLFCADGLRIRQGDRVLFGERGLSLSVRGPERIALTGANGVGKTTLLKVLAGMLGPDGGTIRSGSGRVAYLSQRLEGLDPSRSVRENLDRAIPGMPANERARLLARLHFRGERMHLPVASLSGGERVRVVLACVLHAIPAPHLLLLDEPTNHLDLEAVRQLEHALSAYEGAMIVVSHDETFLASIAPTRRWELTADDLREIG